MDVFVNPCDISLWLKVSGFYEYLGEWLLKKEKHVQLVDAAAHPRVGNPEHGKLHEWVFEYMDEICKISKKVPYTFLKWLWSMDEEQVLLLPPSVELH
jgi:hypothetical protein